MKSNKSTAGANPDARMAELVQTIHAAERELQALTGGQVDAVAGEGGVPLLLRGAQEQLRRSEAAQRALAQTQIGILNALPAQIALLDGTGVITVVNEAWRHFASANGLKSPDYSVGQNYLDACEAAHGEFAEESQAVARGIRQVLGGDEKFFALEYPCHSPTEQRWFRLTVTPLSDQPGAGAVVMHVNVTERRLAEEAMREREREQRRLAESLKVETRRLLESQAVANVGSWETDLRTFDVAWTDETYRIFEVSPAEFQPSHQLFLERVHPDDRAKVSAALDYSQGHPDAFAVEHRICLPDGRIKYVEERWQAFNDETGRPARAVGTCQDITARKLADDVLRMRSRQQEVIAKIGFETTRATTLESIFDFTTRIVAEALDVEMCKVLQLTPDGSHLRLVSGVGWQPGLVGVAMVGVDETSQAGFTLKSAGPIFVNDLRQEDRFQAPPLLSQHGVISGLSVVIPLLDKPWGVLGAHCRFVRNFDEHDAQFMQSVAALLTVVIERLAAQRSLTESERRMRVAQRIAHLGNWELDIALNRLSWSDEVYRIYGLNPTDNVSTYEAFRALVHPDDAERMDAAQRRAIAGEETLVIDHRIIRPDGEIRHVRERAELIHDETGFPLLLAGTVLDITERIQAEELSAAIVASALDGIITIDHEDRILEFNPSAEAIFGWPKAAVLGRNLSEFIIPERLRDRHRRGMARYLATGEKRTLDRRLELPAMRADGTEIVIELNATQLGQRTPPQFTAFVRDITQSKVAVDNLRASEARFRALFDQVAVGMCLVSVEGNFLSTNPRFCEIVGYSAEELLTRNCIETTHPDDRAREAEITTRMLTGELRTSHWEKRYLRQDGRVIWCNMTLALIPGHPGEVPQFVGVVEDITKRRQSEAQLRLLETCVARLNDIVLITDAEPIDDTGPRILYVNDAFVRRTGFSREEAIGKTPRLLQGHKTQRDALDRIRTALQAWQPVREELINYTKLGEEFWIELDIVPVADAKGWFTHWVAIERDITERKKAEAVMKGIVQTQQELAMSDLSVQAVMTLIAERASALTDAAGGVVELVDGAELVYTACTGVVADKVGMRVQRGSSLSGLSVNTDAVLMAQDTETDPRCDRVACRKIGVRSMVVAPLRVGTEVLGVLKVMSDRPAAFTNRDVDNLQILTETLGTVMQRQRAAELLRESEAEFRTLAEAMPQIVWIARSDGWITYLNHHWMDYTGLTLEESLGHGWSKPFHPDDRPLAEAAWQQSVTLLRDYSMEARLQRADGAYRWWLIRAEALRDAPGPVRQWFGTCTDIHDLKVAQLEITRTNRALKMLSACSEALVREATEADLLAAFCRHSHEIGGYRLAWVGYAQEDAARTISCEAQFGDDNGYLDSLQLSWDATVAIGRGPAGRVIRSGIPEICANIELDDEFMPWRSRALQHGLRGVICLPLRASGRTFGLLTLYSSEVNHPGADELKLLQEMADDLAFGIGNIRSRQERRRMETAVMQVATIVSASISDNFFIDLAVSGAAALNAQGAFVARLLPGEPVMARTVAAVLDGLVVENFDYAVLGTPCENLTDSDGCVVSADVAGQFPQSLTLNAFGAQAYVGQRLVNTAGQTVGWMFVLFREPLKDAGFVTSTLQIFATRAASEFERLAADMRIREQAALLDKATDAILVRDLEHRVVFWNRGAEIMYGWTSAEVLGRPTSEFLVPDMAPFHSAMAAVIEKGEWTGELEKQNRAHGILTVECRWTLVLNESGDPQSILCIETDITERKKLEVQFLRAQRLESVGTLAGGIAHDMNNILSPITLSIELLKGDSKDAATLDLLDTLEAGAKRGANLVRQLMSFARGVDGQRNAVNLSHLITELQNVMKEVFPKNVEFQISASDDLWTIIGDASQLHQVFLNLCVNARDAMPHGGKLTITMENIVLDETYAAMNLDGKTGAFVVIGVTDTGTGIKPAVLNKIFEPFFTTKELGRGTGLGLSTVIGIIKKHGGFVNVYSEEGKGTEFKVYLPAQASDSQVVEVAVSQTGIPRGQGELILVVDDEKGIRDIAAKTLTRFGYRVLEAANGAEAVVLYVQRQKDIALVLTDVSMPIMDGAALVVALRSLNPDVRVLISSGLPMNGEVAKAMESGVRHFIPKPYTAEKLLGIIYTELHS